MYYGLPLSTAVPQVQPWLVPVVVIVTCVLVIVSVIVIIIGVVVGLKRYSGKEDCPEHTLVSDAIKQ